MLHSSALAFLSILLSGPALAGEDLLANDGFEDGDLATFHGGFIVGECWGSIFEPEVDGAAYTLRHVDALIGGSAGEQIFTVGIYEVDPDDSTDRTLLGAEAVAITGSSSAFNRITIAELELGVETHIFDGTHVMIPYHQHQLMLLYLYL